MVSEVILPAESFPADVARVGPLVRMSPFVDEEIVGLGELTVAVLADELFLGSSAGHSWCSHWRWVTSW